MSRAAEAQEWRERLAAIHVPMPATLLCGTSTVTLDKRTLDYLVAVFEEGL